MEKHGFWTGVLMVGLGVFAGGLLATGVAMAVNAVQKATAPTTTTGQ